MVYTILQLKKIFVNPKILFYYNILFSSILPCLHYLCIEQNVGIMYNIYVSGSNGTLAEYMIKGDTT